MRYGRRSALAVSFGGKASWWKSLRTSPAVAARVRSPFGEPVFEALTSYREAADIQRVTNARHWLIATRSQLTVLDKRMIILLMGVTGAGKTTIGRLLAGQLHWDFVDADQFHSPANVEKMRRGIALTDTDREPWIEGIRQAMLMWVEERKDVVLACSALKRGYREQLQIGPMVKLVYLRGSYDLIFSRLQERHGHFATTTLLASQFADLEEPADALIVDAAGSREEIVATIRRALALS